MSQHMSQPARAESEVPWAEADEHLAPPCEHTRNPEGIWGRVDFRWCGSTGAQRGA
eukprot:CAMPEP_0181221060 /NCGR_PEP_ID=MMETSP1096-20121128/29181_1 /TAXON_ID=156174 ORGANISM="Chrysochromulina ericina, Strain CCMP281" /NCGR_SAMPLE_ID=MMETSP1096 /ASSEMBLY_ACC=CAM_ASM_000453 /LENGTH=55 /DNA_ID=CAMNT_0023313629 /DNA_START=269 /DNA_END=432 /DNA_ORIENTATION=-